MVEETEQAEGEKKPVICEMHYPADGGDPSATCYIEVPSENVHIYGDADSISLANQFGRLDLISIVLVLLGAAIAFFSIIGYSQVRSKSKEIAEDRAESASKKWLEENAPEHIEEAVELYLFMNNIITDKQADEMGKTQPEAEPKGDEENGQ